MWVKELDDDALLQRDKVGIVLQLIEEVRVARRVVIRRVPPVPYGGDIFRTKSVLDCKMAVASRQELSSAAECFVFFISSKPAWIAGQVLVAAGMAQNSWSLERKPEHSGP